MLDRGPLASTGQLYGLEKFWAFLKYSKNKSMEIDPKLQEHLSKFKRLEDFRIDASRDDVSGGSAIVKPTLWTLMFYITERGGGIG